MFYVYHSELTHNTLVTTTNHGIIWEQEDEEVYDFVVAADEAVITEDGDIYPR